MRTTTILLLAAGAALAACGSGAPDAADAPPPGPDAQPGDPFAPPMGSIVITEQRGNWSGQDEPAAGTSITLIDGPRDPFHHEVSRTGECRLLAYTPGNCPGVCDGICTSDGCLPWPRLLDAGAITVTGTSAPLTFMHDEINGRYYPGAVPVDLFEPGATITASAEGGPDLAAFALSTTAPAALETSVPSPLPLSHADDVELRWTPASDGAVMLRISSANTSHGVPYAAIIECASPDDGLITVPGAFVAELGVVYGDPCLVGNECPPATLTRYRRGATTTAAGEVELWAATERVFYVRHDAP